MGIIMEYNNPWIVWVHTIHRKIQIIQREFQEAEQSPSPPTPITSTVTHNPPCSVVSVLPK